MATEVTEDTIEDQSERLFDRTDSMYLLVRAVALALLDEINVIRVQGGAQPITKPQLRNRIRAKIRSGNAG